MYNITHFLNFVKFLNKNAYMTLNITKTSNLTSNYKIKIKKWVSNLKRIVISPLQRIN